MSNTAQKPIFLRSHSVAIHPELSCFLLVSGASVLRFELRSDYGARSRKAFMVSSNCTTSSTTPASKSSRSASS